jgi:hypothetical protein
MRAADLFRTLLGALELVAPGVLLRRVGVRGDQEPARAVVRLLGTRHLLQAAVTVARATPRTRLIGAVVDAAHALTMYALAAGSTRYRRAALTSAATATALALDGAQSSHRSR